MFHLKKLPLQFVSNRTQLFLSHISRRAVTLVSCMEAHYTLVVHTRTWICVLLILLLCLCTHSSSPLSITQCPSWSQTLVQLPFLVLTCFLKPLCLFYCMCVCLKYVCLCFSACADCCLVDSLFHTPTMFQNKDRQCTESRQWKDTCFSFVLFKDTRKKQNTFQVLYFLYQCHCYSLH